MSKFQDTRRSTTWPVLGLLCGLSGAMLWMLYRFVTTLHPKLPADGGLDPLVLGLLVAGGFAVAVAPLLVATWLLWRVGHAVSAPPRARLSSAPGLEAYRNWLMRKERDLAEASGPLRDSELSPDDATLLLSGAVFGPDSHVILPSGRHATSEQIQRWLNDRKG